MTGLCEHGAMRPFATTTRFAYACGVMIAVCSVAFAHHAANAAGCAFEPQGAGRVAAVIDARSFRLDDGREVLLAGVEPVVSELANRPAALAAMVLGREVTRRGEDDTPDRYGRQPAFVFFEGSDDPI